MAFGFFKRDMHISAKGNCDDTSHGVLSYSLRYGGQQPPQSLNPPPGAPAQGYPQCATCSSRQGGLIMWFLRRLGFQ